MQIMRVNSHHISAFIAGILVLCALALSGCAGAVVVGTAAVAASMTEKGFSTSVSDGVIFAKLNENFYNRTKFYRQTLLLQ